MSSQSLLPRAGDVIANRYRVDALIGQGGMGAAYAATNLVTGKRIALKWILREQHASRLHRLLREARAASRIRHPNIVDVYDVGEHEGALFLVMELLSGQSLQALIDECAPLTIDQVLRWMLPVLRGVRAAHRQGVIHRDLKPANIFLCSNDSPEPALAKVLDFGVCKLLALNGADDAPSLTDSGALVGTPSYMAPEQLQDARSVDVRADIYACGAVLYHALSGRRPFEADSYASLVVKVLTAEPPALAAVRPDLPAALCVAIHRAMQRQPELRFADIDDLISALEPFADPRDVRQHRMRAPRRHFAGSARGVAWLVAAFVAAFVGLGLSLSRAASTPEPAREKLADVTPEAEPLTSTASLAEQAPSLLTQSAPAESVAACPAPAPRHADDTSAADAAAPRTRERPRQASTSRRASPRAPIAVGPAHDGSESVTAISPAHAEPPAIIELESEEF